MGKLQTNRPILKKRFLLLCLIGYLLTTLVLLCWIKRLQPQPQPKINEISVDKKSATLSIRGDGLSEGLDAVITISPEHEQYCLGCQHL